MPIQKIQQIWWFDCFKKVAGLIIKNSLESSGIIIPMTSSTKKRNLQKLSYLVFRVLSLSSLTSMWLLKLGEFGSSTVILIHRFNRLEKYWHLTCSLDNGSFRYIEQMRFIAELQTYPNVCFLLSFCICFVCVICFPLRILLTFLISSVSFEIEFNFKI